MYFVIYVMFLCWCMFAYLLFYVRSRADHSLPHDPLHFLWSTPLLLIRLWSTPPPLFNSISSDQLHLWSTPPSLIHSTFSDPLRLWSTSPHLIYSKFSDPLHLLWSTVPLHLLWSTPSPLNSDFCFLLYCCYFFSLIVLYKIISIAFLLCCC